MLFRNDSYNFYERIPSSFSNPLNNYANYTNYCYCCVKMCFSYDSF